jgi:hypothetical protein
MATDCCKVVGNLNLCSGGVDLGCVLSINASSRLEIIKKCGNKLLVGSIVGTLSITSYATDTIYTGCPSRANVSIQWLKRLDCDRDKTYFIAAGEGPSSIAGNIKGKTTLYYLVNNKQVDIAVLNSSIGREYSTISASSSGGPAAIYMHTNQVDGYGLTYAGGPIKFDTSIVPKFNDLGPNNNGFYSTVLPPFGVRNSNGGCDPLCGNSLLYLQSFSLEMNPGEIPIASYSFNFVIDDI